MDGLHLSGLMNVKIVIFYRCVIRDVFLVDEHQVMIKYVL